MVKETNLFALY